MGKTPSYLAVKVSFRAAREKKKKIYIYIYIYINIYIVCVLTWSLLGVKESLGNTQIGLL